MLMKNDENKQKTVLFIFHYTDMNNGAVRSMVEVIENLILHHNINAVLFYSGNEGSAIRYLKKYGVHCYSVKFGRIDYRLTNPFWNKIEEIAKLFLKYIFTLARFPVYKRIVKREKITLIYSNTTVVYLGSMLSKACKLPHIWHIREFGKEDHDIGFMFGEKNLYRRINKSASGVVYISESIKKKYEKHIYREQYVVYNDVSKQFINYKQNPLSNDKKILDAAIIGTIQEGKGQLEAIKAIEIALNRGCLMRLHIAGKQSGDYYKKIVEYVEKNNLGNNIVFDGFIYDTNSYRQKMDIGIVASTCEAFGRVTIEGMLSVLLMIGADSAGTSELITDGLNGYLYNVGDIEALATKLIWVDRNRETCRKVAELGFNYAIERFTQGLAADELYEIIKKYSL